VNDKLTRRERIAYRTATGLVLATLFVLDPLVFFGLLVMSYFYFTRSRSAEAS
jgi:hypothetical protein